MTKATLLASLAFLASVRCVGVPASVFLQRDGIRTVSLITDLPLEGYPFEQWNRGHEWAYRDRADARASHVRFDTRKRAEWHQFVGAYRSNDVVYRIKGSHIPKLFDYFVIVRNGKELTRYYVFGGDGLAAVE